MDSSTGMLTLISSRSETLFISESWANSCTAKVESLSEEEKDHSFGWSLCREIAGAQKRVVLKSSLTLTWGVSSSSSLSKELSRISCSKAASELLSRVGPAVADFA